MTRSTLQFDQRIADWLELDPNVAPPDVLTTVVAALPSIPQARRGLLAPRRFTTMPISMRLAAVGALMAAVGVGALAFVGGGPAPAETLLPSPSPTSSIGASSAPTASFDFGSGTAFSSPVYGYDARYPAGWKVTQGAMQGSAADLAIAETTSGAATFWDHFDPAQATPGPRLLGTSTLLPSDMTIDEWIVSYQAPQVEQAGRACIPERASWEPITIDGSAGQIYVGCEYVESLVVVDGRIYIFSFVSRFATQAEVESSGRQTLEGFVGTVSLHAQDAAAPSSFTSSLYGYTVTVPEGWDVTPATVHWVFGAQPTFDRFAAPVSQNPDFDDVFVAAQPVPDGMTPADWLVAYAGQVAGSARDCKGPVDAWVDETAQALRIRRLDLECQGIRVSDVAFVVDGTGYVMSGNGPVITQFLTEFDPGG